MAILVNLCHFVHLPALMKSARKHGKWNEKKGCPKAALCVTMNNSIVGCLKVETT
jgi:hypothetical protein